MIALIDSDSLLYKAGFSFEDKTNWNELLQAIGVTEEKDVSITSNLIEAKNAIDGIIENIKFKTGCEDIELWLTGHKNNFRYKVDNSYKSNRKDSRKPIDFENLWDYLITKYKANVAEGYEADDIVVTKKTNNPSDYFLCAIDKDVLYQTEGTHYNYNSDEFIEVSKKDSLRFLYYQVLNGDPTDGYKGVTGIGDVKANKILDEAEENKNSFNSLEEAYCAYCVHTAMEKMKLSFNKALKYIQTQARLASMHQLKIDKKGNYKVVLWTPPINH